jgi:hypothetical protein
VHHEMVGRRWEYGVAPASVMSYLGVRSRMPLAEMVSYPSDFLYMHTYL